MFIFRKARSPRQTLSDLDEYITGASTEPIEWLAREVKSWGEFSYVEIEQLILNGQLNDLIDWQVRYADVINRKLASQWTAAITAASAKATKGKVVLDDSDEYVKAWLKTHGAELVTRLSEESKAALAMIILHGQAQRLNPFEIAKQIRPIIGLNQRQAAANVAYREKVYRQLTENGMSAIKAAERADKAAVRYASKQHRFRAETIVNTELAFAYNRGAHMGVGQAIANGLMGRCEMVWSTAGTNRVCSRCLALKDTVVGHTDESGVTIPPLHPRCRCAIMYREVAEPRVVKPPKTYRSFNSADEANEYFGKTARDKTKPYGKWRKEITDAEKRAVKKYTSNYYTEMNGYLRGFISKSSFSYIEFERLEKAIKNCETALEKSVLPEDILVHRQAGRGMLDIYKNAPNGIFLDEGFTSTSPVKGSFTGSIDIEINIPAGKGAGMWVDPISEFKGENEFLLNRGTEFKVLEIDESGNRPLVKLEVVGREPKEVFKMLKKEKDKEKQEEKQRRSGKFSWEPADIKVQNGNGDWIRGDKFLRKEDKK